MKTCYIVSKTHSVQISAYSSRTEWIGLSDVLGKNKQKTKPCFQSSHFVYVSEDRVGDDGGVCWCVCGCVNKVCIEVTGAAMMILLSPMSTDFTNVDAFPACIPVKISFGTNNEKERIGDKPLHIVSAWIERKTVITYMSNTDI